ncbi:MAG TPA: acetyl-coenzyme A synthetase N-terminal domain-containing protein, partial [Vicinamibacterales bacterium]
MAQPTPSPEIADLLKEDRTFPPSDTFRSRAAVRDEDVYARAERDPEAFWASFAEELEWFSKWTHVLTWSPPHA